MCDSACNFVCLIIHFLRSLPHLLLYSTLWLKCVISYGFPIEVVFVDLFFDHAPLKTDCRRLITGIRGHGKSERIWFFIKVYIWVFFPRHTFHFEPRTKIVWGFCGITPKGRLLHYRI